MSRFSAIVCDHCDVRDIVDAPSTSDIQEVFIEISVCKPDISRTTTGLGGTSNKHDLCARCRENLTQTIIIATTQQPRTA